MIPLSLYIHIPWCEKKCPYCDFNSHLARTSVDEPAYINALLQDLDADIVSFGAAITEREIQSIFIGGGTPSLFKAESIQSLLQGVQSRLDFSHDIEITLEANPGSSEREKFSGFRQAGVNRLSIGVQSFNATHLKKLGRAHNSEEALSAARYARDAGFDNFNLDLMFGLPEQSTEQALRDVQSALDIAPTHLSCYQLTIEPNTLFHHQPPPIPSDDAIWGMQTTIQGRLAENGYHHYEVSAYAKPGHQCRHNLNYWQFGDYLGIGAGAHGKITTAENVTRNWKVKHPTSYLNRAQGGDTFGGATNVIDPAELAFEFMMNALRLSAGFDLDLLQQRTGRTLDSVRKQLDDHQQKGLIEINENQLRLSDRGQQMINEMLQDYLPD